MKKKSLAYPEDDFRICILAFSQSHLQISVRTYHSDKEILPNLTMSDGVLYGNVPCLRVAEPVALQRIQNAVQDSLKDWAYWPEIATNNISESVVLVK